MRLVRLQHPGNAEHAPRRVAAAAGLVALCLALLGCTAPVPVDDDPAPTGVDRPAAERILDEVIYGAVPGLWRRHGETGADAVRRRLPAIADLGATVVWLWPPVSTRERGEEYAITDYDTIDDSWGGRRELAALVRDAHRLDLRVIVDVVPNHTSRQHPWFADAHSAADATWHRYERDADGVAEHYFDWRHLPNLDVDDADVRDALADSMLGLLDLGVDGFRFDVAWGPAERSPGFWPDLVQRLRAADPDAILLAEANAGHDWLADAGMDLGYDWGAELGQWAWSDVFGRGGASRLADLLVEPSAVPVLRYLDNNDTGARFAAARPRWARVAAIAEFAAPGVPLVFAGQETGSVYEPYAVSDAVDAAVPTTRDGRGLESLYRELIALRQSHDALRVGAVSGVRVDGDLLTFSRGGGCEVALVLGPRGAELTVAEPADRVVATSPRLADEARAAGALQLPGYSGLVRC